MDIAAVHGRCVLISGGDFAALPPRAPGDFVIACDRGVVLLIDDRFNTAAYRALFPPHWRGARRVTAQTLPAELTAFWAQTNVGLSMMCYKNQKTSPLDKNECK